MSSPDQRLVLERLAADACPPLEQVEVDGWRLRAAEGVTKRANSALPLSDAMPVDEVVDFYRQRGLPPRVQVSTAAVDDALAARGWERGFEVVVLAGPVPTTPTSSAATPATPATPAGPAHHVTLTSAPDRDWLDCWWAVDGRGGPAQLDVAERTLQRIPSPTAYASVRQDGRTVAVGRAVCQQQHLGVFAMAVRPDARCRGLGRAVLHALGSWGAAHGARTAYLQVLEDNAPALGLYAAAGLVPAHRYHYRTLV